MKFLEPNARFNKITDITAKFLKEHGIKGLILDVDNTLITLDKKPLEDVEKWIEDIKDAGFKICIASNSIHKERVETIAKKLDIPFIYFSVKPLRIGLYKARKLLGLESKYIAEVGDQLFTDVIGANRMKMFTILTEPISPEKYKINNVKRKIEKKILKKKEDKKNKKSK